MNSNQASTSKIPTKESTSCLIKVIQDGQVKLIHPPTFGQVVFSFHDGKMKWVDNTTREQFK